MKSNLPNEWQETTLGEICDVKHGNSITKDKITDGDVPVVAGGQQPAYYHNVPNRTCPVITVSGSGAYAGFVNYFEIPIFASDCSTVQPKNNQIFCKFIYFLMKSKQSDIYKMQKGIAQPHVYSKDLEKVSVLLPPLPIQKKIVSILEKAENLKQKREEADKLTNEYLKSVFNEMFYNKGFEEVELGDKKICEISGEYGSGAGAIEYDGKTRYIRITDIGEDGKLRNDVVSPSIIEDKYLLKIGDLLFARTGATVGKTYLHSSDEKNYQYAGYLIRFRFNENILPEYVYYFTKTNKYLSWVASTQKVVAQPNINSKQYSSLTLPLPPIKIQQKFASIVEKVEKLKEKQKESKEKINEMFDALMQKAFRGEL